MQQTLPMDPSNTTVSKNTVFEQPLNERMRNLLRLEFLYQQALYHNQSPTPWSSRAAISSLLEILAITARGDPRNDVLKDLDRQITILKDFQARPGVDNARLRAVLARLTLRRDSLQATSAGTLTRLRENELLAAIKHRSTIPGGTCDFDLPNYFHWLNLSADTRQTDFNQWLEALRPLCESVTDLLWVTRENARPRREIAVNGCYQIAFERDTLIQLLRITLCEANDLFPEISGGHHRCNIRFLSWSGVEQRPTQATGDIAFILTCST